MNDIGRTIGAIKLAVEHVPQVPPSRDTPGASKAQDTLQPREDHPNKVQLGRDVLEF